MRLGQEGKERRGDSHYIRAALELSLSSRDPGSITSIAVASDSLTTCFPSDQGRRTRTGLLIARTDGTCPSRRRTTWASVPSITRRIGMRTAAAWSTVRKESKSNR